MRRQDLDGDGAIEARVARAIDLAHTARAEQGVNAVRSEQCTGFQIEFLEHRCGALEHRLVDQHRHVVVRKQRLDLSPQVFVPFGLCGEKPGAVARLSLDGRVVENSDPLPALGIQLTPLRVRHSLPSRPAAGWLPDCFQ